MWKGGFQAAVSRSGAWKRETLPHGEHRLAKVEEETAFDCYGSFQRSVGCQDGHTAREPREEARLGLSEWMASCGGVKLCVQESDRRRWDRVGHRGL